MNSLPQFILDECKKYAHQFPNQECCAVITKQNNNLKFKPCENIHPDKQGFFAINPEEFIYNDVAYVFHTHWNGPCRPSSFDKKSSDELCVPFLIYSLIDDRFFLYENISV